MKTKNLITLGAICQKKFNMPDGFEVHEFTYDPSHTVFLRRAMVENETLLPINSEVSPVGPGIIEERIELVLFGTKEDNEYMWCGYSSRMNTLCVMPDK